MSQQGFKSKKHELIERLMPTFKSQTNAQPQVQDSSTDLNLSNNESTKISNELSNLAINQSRNLLNLENSILTFKELNLFPRVFLLLQEI